MHRFDGPATANRLKRNPPRAGFLLPVNCADFTDSQAADKAKLNMPATAICQLKAAKKK
jgi:hypothetical protein